MTFESPYDLDNSNAIFYSASRLITEQTKNKTAIRRIGKLIEKFFNNEKVQEIEEISLSNKLSFSLMVLWKAVQIQLNVNVDKFGLATFQFYIPDQEELNKFHFENEDIPCIDKLLNIINTKKLSWMSNYLINFKRDISK